MNKLCYINLISGVVLFVFSLGMIYIIIPNYTDSFSDSYISPRAVPYIVTYTILVCSLFLIANSASTIIKRRLLIEWPISLTDIKCMLVIISMMMTTTYLY